MKIFYFFNVSVCFILLVCLLNSCLDLSDDALALNASNSIEKVRIDSQVLAAITTQIAGQPPMRGGRLFGSVKGNEVDIQYFLYDYASIPSSGSYQSGNNSNQNIGLALGYEEKSNKKALALYLGSVLSMPGSMNYVTSYNEQTIEKEFELNPQLQIYVHGIVTMGNDALTNLGAHELKLSNKAKISFFIKERGQSVKKVTAIKQYNSLGNSYKKMHSYINGASHVLDVSNKFNLNTLSIKFNLSTLSMKSHSSLQESWHFSITAPQKRKALFVNFDWTYPTTPPTFLCTELDAQSEPVKKIVEEQAVNWQSDEKNPKNFEESFEYFLRNKCPLN